MGRFVGRRKTRKRNRKKVLTFCRFYLQTAGWSLHLNPNMEAVLNVRRPKSKTLPLSEMGFYRRKKRFPNAYTVCSKCGQKKRLKDFSSERLVPDDLGLTLRAVQVCWACSKARNKESMYFCQAKRRYGLKKEDYWELYQKQKGVCAICEGACRKNKRLSVDHDHGSGRVRGLLCASCNRGLGMFLDNPLRLRKAAEYLESYETGV